jgi:hypothetical protein
MLLRCVNSQERDAPYKEAHMSNSTPVQHPLQLNSTESAPSDQFPDTTVGLFNGAMRTLHKRICSCGTPFYLPKHLMKEQRYCSKNCPDKFKHYYVNVTCANCGKVFEKRRSKVKNSKSGLFFCNAQCKQNVKDAKVKEAIKPDHYGTGITVYRKNAIKHFGAKCKVCGYDTFERMLDVDHIDSNRLNNALENLQVLCVWCHALKTRGVPYHAHRNLELG